MVNINNSITSINEWYTKFLDLVRVASADECVHQIIFNILLINYSSIIAKYVSHKELIFFK